MTELEMPAGAEVLTVQRQGDGPVLWAMVNTTAPKERRRFLASGTGHDLPPGVTRRRYVGTFQLPDPIFGVTVWHVFDMSEVRF